MPTMTQIHISSQFDSGAIEVLSVADPRDIQVAIRKDNAADFAQWFHFALHGAAQVPVTLRFMNAGACAYPDGWVNYRVVASHDRQHWFRIDTQFDGQVMTTRLTPETQCVYFAYFEPYSYEQHLDLLGSVSASHHVQQQRLGSTLDGRDMTLLRITQCRRRCRRSAAQKGMADCPPAPRRDHGRVVCGGLSGAPAGPR